MVSYSEEEWCETMKAQISLITILTNDVPKMRKFYQQTLGFPVKTDMDSYVEFESQGVRFSICTRQTLSEATGGHESFSVQARGQSFELAFPCESADDVATSYRDVVAKGATPIQEPATMPWGQTTAFFADPEGNIHELFSD